MERPEFGLAGGAVTSGSTTPWRRVLAIAAGPLTEIAFGSLLWAAGGGCWDNPAGAAGFLSLVNGAGNLLPVHKSLDGYRLMGFLRPARRGNEPLDCVPEGLCPACNAASAELERSKEAPRTAA